MSKDALIRRTELLVTERKNPKPEKPKSANRKELEALSAELAEKYSNDPQKMLSDPKFARLQKLGEFVEKEDAKEPPDPISLNAAEIEKYDSATRK